MEKNTFEQTRQQHKIKTERLVLESELVKQLNSVIKRLNDEVDVLNKQNQNLNDAVDMLTKQKIYLQSKLKEKEGNKND